MAKPKNAYVQYAIQRWRRRFVGYRFPYEALQAGCAEATAYWCQLLDEYYRPPTPQALATDRPLTIKETIIAIVSESGPNVSSKDIYNKIHGIKRQSVANAIQKLKKTGRLRETKRNVYSLPTQQSER
jgi:biotin operon repressor